jgi:ABC-type transport system involved in multi-copper enzyme maturation permease subunit
VSTSAIRIRAVMRKEFREYRRNRFIIYTMATLPIIFTALPVISLFTIQSSADPTQVRTQVAITLLLLLIIPVVLPATIAAYSVIGERDQGTLEPLLTTPISREEFLLGKSLAATIPTVAVAYGFFLVLVLAIRFGASRVVSHAVWQPAWFLAELLFAPLLAAWSVWVGTAISARSSDVRVAQQLGTLASLPALVFPLLMSLQIFKPTATVAVVVAVALAAIDVVAWRIVSKMFDRERLITGASAVTMRAEAGT